jgi:glycosyltransferase involved in cell wall biosynthesis
MEPKLIKGPDIFYEVIKKLNEIFDVHVFLTGPARGYIKKQLDKSKIPYTHLFLENFLDLVNCYNVLDLYIVSSRAEGGPKAILESFASGVPIVTTKVGMAPLVVKQGFNGYVAEIEDKEQIIKYSVEVLKNEDLRNNFILNGLETVQKYSWENIAKLYYKKIYKKLLN